jgi:hypothetical protein
MEIIMKVSDILTKRAERCRLPRVAEDEGGVIRVRRGKGDGDVPWLVFDEEWKRANSFGECVFVITRSISGESWCLRVSPSEKMGSRHKHVGRSILYRKFQFGENGPIISWWEGYDDSPDGHPIYVKRLRGITYDEAYGHAEKLIRSWGMPPIIFEMNSKNFKKNFTSVDAREFDEAVERWYDAL